MSALDVVRAWVDAVNTSDVRTVMTRSAGDIELVGPRGTARGQPALRDWVERAGLQMTTERAFAGPDEVVLWQRLVWRDHAGLVVAAAAAAHHFRVTGGRVSRVARYERLEEALLASGLTEAAEVGPAAGGSGS